MDDVHVHVDNVRDGYCDSGDCVGDDNYDDGSLNMDGGRRSTTEVVVAVKDDDDDED